MLLKTESALPRFGVITLSCLLLGLFWYWWQPLAETPPAAPAECVQLETHLKKQGAYFLNWESGVLVLVRPAAEPKLLQVAAEQHATACLNMLQQLNH